MTDDLITFDIVDGTPVPIFPITGREPNGITILNLAECVVRHGGTADERRKQWIAAWGRYADEAATEPTDRRSDAVASMVGWDATRRTLFSHITEDHHWEFIRNFLREHRVPATEIGARIEVDEHTDKQIVQIICKIAVIRRMADRSGKRVGESPPEFLDAQGNWTPAPWLNENTPPVAARVKVWRSDCPEPFVAIAEWKRCVQFTRDANDNVILAKAWDGANGPFQLGRCASSACHRLAFPDAVGQTYSDDEIAVGAKSGAAPEARAAVSRTSSIASMPSVDLVTGEVREPKEIPSFPDDPRQAMDLVDDSTPEMSRLPIELVFAGAVGNVEGAKDAIQNKYRRWWPRLYNYSDPRVFVAVVLKHVRDRAAAAA